jgi:hypothetical protein
LIEPTSYSQWNSPQSTATKYHNLQSVDADDVNTSKGSLKFDMSPTLFWVYNRKYPVCDSEIRIISSDIDGEW